MSDALRIIKVKDIINYYENPRHAVAMNEKDTLKKLFAVYFYVVKILLILKKHGNLYYLLF